MQSLIDPDVFAKGVICRLDSQHPELRMWNGSSYMRVIENVVREIAKEYQSVLDKQLDQHFRDMDLHRKSMLAEIRNFYDDFQKFALITGRRIPEFGNHYTTNDPQIKEQYDSPSQQDNNHTCPIDP